MPRITDDSLEQHQLPTGQFGYSAASLDELGATEYTLATIVQDISGSVAPYESEMEAALKEVVKACKFSPRADNLMLRLLLFEDSLSETHGFKLLEECNIDDYNDCLRPGGTTALFDASENAISATADYGKQLADNDYTTNAIIFIITDGCDNASTLTATEVKKALAKLVQSELVESVITVLIGVGADNNPVVKDMLDQFAKDAELTQFIALGDANAKTLAKLAEFISKSISAQSQALGTGGASQPISLNI